MGGAGVLYTEDGPVSDASGMGFYCGGASGVCGCAAGARGGGVGDD